MKVTDEHKDGSRFAAKCGKGFGPPVTEVDWYVLVAKMAETPPVKELRSMSAVVKKTNTGVKEHGISVCTLSQVAECREKNEEGGFSWPGRIPNRQGWVRGWNAER